MERDRREYRTWVGAQYQFNCPRNGKLTRSVWGTNIYTDDSSVCAAAVHAGSITTKDGGKVTIEMREGQASYRASTRNKVKSLSYPAWPGSFIVVGAPEGPDDPEAFATGDVTVNGQPFTSGRSSTARPIDVTGGTLKLERGRRRLARHVRRCHRPGASSSSTRSSTRQEGREEAKRTTAELALNGGDFGACGAWPRVQLGGARAGKNVRSLWAQGKGRFRTKGKSSSASIRGTKWQTTDRVTGR